MHSRRLSQQGSSPARQERRRENCSVTVESQNVRERTCVAATSYPSTRGREIASGPKCCGEGEEGIRFIGSCIGLDSRSPHSMSPGVCAIGFSVVYLYYGALFLYHVPTSKPDPEYLCKFASNSVSRLTPISASSSYPWTTPPVSTAYPQHHHNYL